MCINILLPFFIPQLPIVEKIRIIAQKVYGAQDIELSPTAQIQIDHYSRQVKKHAKHVGHGWPWPYILQLCKLGA